MNSILTPSSKYRRLNTNRLFDSHESEMLDNAEDYEAGDIMPGRDVQVWTFRGKKYDPEMSLKLLETPTETYYKAPHGQRFKVYRKRNGKADCMLITKDELLAALCGG